jgi:hypothetical protein
MKEVLCVAIAGLTLFGVFTQIRGCAADDLAKIRAETERYRAMNPKEAK